MSKAGPGKGDSISALPCLSGERPFPPQLKVDEFPRELQGLLNCFLRISYRACRSVAMSWSQLAQEKLLQQIGDGTRTNSDGRIFESQLDTIPILSWIVKVRDPARGQIPQHIGIIGLPASIVALTNH